MTNGVGFLNDWTVCDGIREGHTQFNDICPSCLHGKQYGDGIVLAWKSGSDEGNEHCCILSPLEDLANAVFRYMAHLGFLVGENLL